MAARVLRESARSPPSRSAAPSGRAGISQLFASWAGSGGRVPAASRAAGIPRPSALPRARSVFNRGTCQAATPVTRRRRLPSWRGREPEGSQRQPSVDLYRCEMRAAGFIRRQFSRLPKNPSAVLFRALRLFILTPLRDSSCLRLLGLTLAGSFSANLLGIAFESLPGGFSGPDAPRALHL